MKAYKGIDGSLRLFRPDLHLERFRISAERLVLPVFEIKDLLACIERFVLMERDWIPDGIGYALYLRPLLFGTQVQEAFLGNLGCWCLKPGMSRGFGFPGRALLLQ